MSSCLLATPYICNLNYSAPDCSGILYTMSCTESRRGVRTQSQDTRRTNLSRYSSSGTVQYLPCYRGLGTVPTQPTGYGSTQGGNSQLRFRLALWPDDPQKGRTKLGGHRGYPCSRGPFCRRRPASTRIELTNSNRRRFSFRSQCFL